MIYFNTGWMQYCSSFKLAFTVLIFSSSFFFPLVPYDTNKTIVYAQGQSNQEVIGAATVVIRYEGWPSMGYGGRNMNVPSCFQCSGR